MILLNKYFEIPEQLRNHYIEKTILRSEKNTQCNGNMLRHRIKLFSHGYSFVEIGRITGVSGERARQVIYKAIQRTIYDILQMRSVIADNILMGGDVLLKKEHKGGKTNVYH